MLWQPRELYHVRAVHSAAYMLVRTSMHASKCVTNLGQDITSRIHKGYKTGVTPELLQNYGGTHVPCITPSDLALMDSYPAQPCH